MFGRDIDALGDGLMALVKDTLEFSVLTFRLILREPVIVPRWGKLVLDTTILTVMKKHAYEKK